MPTIGFDPSLTHFAWVLFDEHKSGKESVMDFGTFVTDPTSGMRVQRLIMQRERVKSLLVKHNIKFVSIEAPYLMDFNTELLYALNQYIHEVFLNLGVFVLYIQPQALKKYARPDMKTNDVVKHHMTHQAKQEVGIVGKRLSEHVADAYFAGKIGHRFYQWHFLKSIKDSSLSEFEKEFFFGTHVYVRGIKKGITEYKGVIYRENDQFFDYSKQKNRRTQNIVEELENGCESKKGSKSKGKRKGPDRR